MNNKKFAKRLSNKKLRKQKNLSFLITIAIKEPLIYIGSYGNEV